MAERLLALATVLLVSGVVVILIMLGANLISALQAYTRRTNIEADLRAVGLVQLHRDIEADEELKRRSQPGPVPAVPRG